MQAMVSTKTRRLRHLLLMSMGRSQLGERIKFAREEKGLSQAELARRVGLGHPQSISRYERGETEVPPKRLRAIAEETGRPMSFFVAERLPAGSLAQGDLLEQAERVASMLREALEQAASLAETLQAATQPQPHGATGRRRRSS